MACAALLLSKGCQIAATVRAGSDNVVDAVYRTGSLPVAVSTIPASIAVQQMAA